MSSIESQVVDGVWGEPIPDSGPPAPEYVPAAEESHELPMGQEVARRSAWDVPPSDDVVQVASPAVAVPEPQAGAAPVGEAASSSSPTSTAPTTTTTTTTTTTAELETMRQQIADLTRYREENQRREEEGKRQWEAQVQQYQQQQVFAQRQQAIEEAIEQAVHMDAASGKQFLRSQVGQIEQQYQADLRQAAEQSEQRLREAIRQATAPQWGEHLLEMNGLPRAFAAHLKGLAPEQMEHVVPTLKALYETQTKLEEQMKQTEASNFNQFQKQYGVNRIASANSAPAGTATVKSGTPAHMAAMMAEMIGQ